MIFSGGNKKMNKIPIMICIIILITSVISSVSGNKIEYPNDSFFDKQWALNNIGQTGGIENADIDAVEAWDIETGNPEIIIAIIDSGIDLYHPDLVNNIWENSDEIPDNDIDDNNNGYVDDFNGYDFIFEDNDPYPLDHNGHGTVMSGVISAMTNNEIGISGITWNCKIMPVKVVDANWTASSNSIFDGIKYAADNGAKIICMAFMMFPSSSLKEAINYAYEKGILLICAAGNNGNDRKTYPAAYENVMAVAGTDHSDHRMEHYYEFNGVWVNSSYGDWVDIAAPGEDIYTTQPTYYVTSCDTWGAQLNYDVVSGTTLATPVIAGVAALVFSKNPDYYPDKVRAILKANCDPYDSNFDLGCGRVNAYKALMEFNSEPEKPDAPDGPSSGKPGEFYDYSAYTIDIDGDQIYYLFSWGDGNDSGWLGPFNSDDICIESHNWFDRGDYEIRVKAKDEFGLESEWSDPLLVNMPKNKKHQYSPIIKNLLENLYLLKSLLNNSTNENLIVNNNGKIYGFIQYQNGSNVQNSTILLWEGSPWGFSHLPDEISYTDSKGYYEFENLNYGRYHIDPAKPGFKIGEKNVFLNEENPEIKIDFKAVKRKIFDEQSIIIFQNIIKLL